MEPLVIKRVMPCNKRQLFDAWSQPSLMSKWFFGSQQPRQPSTVTSSFTVGGNYEVIMHLQSGDHRMFGAYREINRYNRIVFSWSSPIISDSIVQLDFKELSPNRTELTLTHTQFPSDSVRTSHVEGWGRCVENLADFLAKIAAPLVATAVPTGSELIRPFIPGKDYELCKRFYETLGFDKVLDGEVAIFNAGSGGFILQRYYQKDWAENTMLQLMVDDLDAWWAHIHSLDLAARFGVQAPKPPALQPWGLRVAYVYDPSGVLWHVCQRREDAVQD